MGFTVVQIEWTVPDVDAPEVFPQIDLFPLKTFIMPGELVRNMNTASGVAYNMPAHVAVIVVYPTENVLYVAGNVNVDAFEKYPLPVVSMTARLETVPVTGLENALKSDPNPDLSFHAERVVPEENVIEADVVSCASSQRKHCVSRSTG